MAIAMAVSPWQDGISLCRNTVITFFVTPVWGVICVMRGIEFVQM